MTQDQQEEQGPEAGQPEREAELSRWTFKNDPPTVEQVQALLAGHPDVYGVAYSAFFDYVQALPQKKTLKDEGGRDVMVPHPTRSGVQVKATETTWTLYMSVAGRQAMLNTAAVLNRWQVNIVPEPTTPTGIPGLLILGDSIVYRELITITGDIVLGTRPGMAWVPPERKNAAASNPFEKVETAARGRAIAAWGIGILPGSGIASLEEMQFAAQNTAGAERAGRRQNELGVGGSVPGSHDTGETPTRDELVESILTGYEAIRTRMGATEDEKLTRMAAYITETLGAVAAVTDNGIDWDKVKLGQLVMMKANVAQIWARLEVPA